MTGSAVWQFFLRGIFKWSWKVICFRNHDLWTRWLTVETERHPPQRGSLEAVQEQVMRYIFSVCQGRPVRDLYVFVFVNVSCLCFPLFVFVYLCWYVCVYYVCCLYVWSVYVLCMHACVINCVLICLCLCVSVLPWLMVSFRIARPCITFFYQALSVFGLVFVYLGKYVCVYIVSCMSVCMCVNVYVCMCV